MKCRYCGAELRVETNVGDPLVRKKDLKSFLVRVGDGSTMCTAKSGAATLHQPEEKTVPTEPPKRETTILALTSIDPAPDNPRGAFELAPEFVASIKQDGILVPITVVPRGDRFEVVFGHRRYHGATEAGLLEVPVEIRYDWERDEMALKSARIVEQIHRENWSDLALGRAFKQLEELGLSQRKIATKTHFNQSTVSRHLALLELPEKAQLWLTDKVITQEEALFIGRLDDGALGTVLETKAPEEIPIVLHHLEESRQCQVELERKVEAFLAEGVTVLMNDDPDGKAKPLSALPWVNLKKHRGEKCRAVVVEAPERPGRPCLVAEWCLVPKNHPRPVRHEERATTQSAGAKQLDELVTLLEAATARRHEFLMGVVPDALEVLTEVLLEEFRIGTDKHLLELLGVEDASSVLTDVDACIKVLWLSGVMGRERPGLTWDQDYQRPRSVETFVLSGLHGQAASEHLDELRELGYEPSPIERLRAGERAAAAELEQLDHPSGNDGPVITIEVKKVGRKHVPVCSICGALEVTSTVTEEKARTAGEDHLWATHGIAPVVPIGAAT